MKAKQQQLTLNGLMVEVTRKKIKNIHLRVYPPIGQVRMSVPLRLSDEAIRQFIISKLDWIKQQQAKMAAQEVQETLEFVSGERHFFQGKSYRLAVIYDAGPPGVILKDTEIELRVAPESDFAQRQRVLLNWYRQKLKELIPALITKWEDIIGVKVAEWGVKQMKTRWGSCNIGARRVWLNLELVKKPIHCLEYVIVHELVHLLERHHNARFKNFMSNFLPEWRSYRQEMKTTHPD